MFGKKRQAAKVEAAEQQKEASEASEISVSEEVTVAPNEKSAPLDRAENGPFDVTEVPSIRPYIDMGAIKLAPREGLQVRLDVDDASKRVIAVSMDFEGATLQVQAFSAPKSTGIWLEVLSELKANLESQGATVIERDGTFGAEILIEPAAGAPENVKPVRFLGVDGPRWMLRGVIVGDAATNQAAAEPIEAVFRELVVVRGDSPMPPKELLPLRVPAGAAQTSKPEVLGSAA